MVAVARFGLLRNKGQRRAVTERCSRYRRRSDHAVLHFGLAPRCPGRDQVPWLRRGIAWLAALLLAVLPFAARAQDDDLPGRVGRIADFAGQLVLSPQDRPTEWEPIGINYPITSGDNLWVSGDGRAEVDYGGGQFRIAGDTSVHVSRLDDRQLALFIAQGRLIVRVRSLDPGDVSRVDTPNTQVTLTRPGLYRIEVAPDREATTLTVREGEAQVALAYGAQQSLPGQTVTVVGSNAVNADIRNSIGVDGFDTWSADRDRRYERGRSTAYVSREMVGYADLDEHGSWQTYPEYGAVWFPTAVAPGWAPYSDGYWTERRRMGAHLGRPRAVGLRAVPLRALGLDRWPLGLVSRRLRSASRLGACARRVGRWPRLGPVGASGRPGLWLGAARLGRCLPPPLAPLLVQLLGALQPPLCGQRDRASGRAAGALCQLRRAWRALGGHRAGTRGPKTGCDEPRQRARVARDLCPGDGERATRSAGPPACPARRRRQRQPPARRFGARACPAPGPDVSGRRFPVGAANSSCGARHAGGGCDPERHAVFIGAGGATRPGTFSEPIPERRADVSRAR